MLNDNDALLIPDSPFAIRYPPFSEGVLQNLWYRPANENGRQESELKFAVHLLADGFCNSQFAICYFRRRSHER